MFDKSLFATGFACADFQGFSIEATDGGLGFGTTYRIYADVDTGDQLNAVFGDGVDPISISTTTSFYQHEAGGATVANQTDFMLNLFPSLALDSYVTIGLDNAEGNAMLEIGIDWTDFEDNGGAISSDNGSWFATPDDPQVLAGDDLRVMVGNFTMYGTDSHVMGVLNLQGKSGNFETFQARGQAFDFALPAPGALALLGLAGIAIRRRRK